jgi:hypothetical protein
LAAENAGALVELRMALPDNEEEWRAASVEQLEALLQAAPLLRVLVAAANCESAEDARRLLRNEAPFGPLHLRTLHVSGLSNAEDVITFAEDAAAHASLTGLDVNEAPLNVPAALDAVVGLAVQRRLMYLELYLCGLSPASAPALARLVADGSLETLAVHGGYERLFSEPAAVLLGNALRSNTTLTSIAFKGIRLFSDTAAAAALLGALTAHPHLQKVDISYNTAQKLSRLLRWPLLVQLWVRWWPQTRPRCASCGWKDATFPTPGWVRWWTRSRPTRTCACSSTATTP